MACEITSTKIDGNGKESAIVSNVLAAMEAKKLSLRVLAKFTGVSEFIIWKAQKGRYVGKFLAECIIDGIAKIEPSTAITLKGRPVCYVCGGRCFAGFRRLKKLKQTVCADCQEG